MKTSWEAATASLAGAEKGNSWFARVGERMSAGFGESRYGDSWFGGIKS